MTVAVQSRNRTSRHRIAHAHDVIGVDALGGQVGMGRIDVVDVEARVGLDADRIALARRHERDAGLAAGQPDLDPALAVAERDVDAQLEAECLGVEGQRLVLVGDGNEDPAELGDVRGLGVRHVGPPDVGLRI